MVEKQAANIKNLSFEELSGVINLYPWYAGARVEFARRTTQFDQALLYVSDRRFLVELFRESGNADYSDDAVRDFVAGATEPSRQIYVAGGDYFTQNQYDNVRRKDDNIFREFARSDKEVSVKLLEEEGSLEAYYTETLAAICVEQEYFDKAKEIYSILSLRYPEKSAYFASLIREIDKISN